jgi:hypothetical protein
VPNISTEITGKKHGNSIFSPNHTRHIRRNLIFAVKLKNREEFGRNLLVKEFPLAKHFGFTFNLTKYFRHHEIDTRSI